MPTPLETIGRPLRNKVFLTGHRRKVLSIIAAVVLLPVVSLGLALKYNYVPPILMYHSVHPRARPENRLEVKAESFERQMRFLREHNYNVIPLEELAGLIRDKKKLKPKTVAITFDDGFRDNYTYAFPVLKKYKIPAAIFIIVKEVGRPQGDKLNWDEILEMQDSGLITIGSHTLTHRYLEEIKTEADLRKEVFESKIILEEKFGRQVNIFSYPSGTFTPLMRSLVIEAGYKCAAATNPGKGYPSDDAFALKRLRISSSSDNLSVFCFEASGYYTFFKERRHK